MTGPTIQTDIISLILRFRLHKYVITADIEKMYRQVLVRPEDRKFQRLLWKSSDKIKTYELNTVSFGLACAPFLAIRCLYQLAEDEGHNFPRASIVLKNDLYVDNLLTGAETIEETKKIRDEVINLLNLGGFPLRQWGANDSRILSGIKKENIIPNLSLDKDQHVKALGIMWDAKSDCIIYTTKQINLQTTISKRTILSEIAKIFDPLGLLGPIILYAKKIMQKLWQLKLEWDESVPNTVYTLWIEFCNQLTLVNNVSFDRKILIEDAINVQLHGFCDASESGYGGCIYIRSTNSTGKIKTNFVIKPLDELPESKRLVCLVTSPVNYNICGLFSSYNKLKRVIAYCMRFKLRKVYQGSLQIGELENAEKIIIKLIQHSEFAEELSKLKQEKPVSKGSKLLTLNPF